MRTTTKNTGKEGKNDGAVGISRRNILKSTALATGALAFGIPATSGYARAASVSTETIYLVDTGTQSTATKLFTVDLDTTPGEAKLTLVETFGSPFNKVDAIAASPDGETVVLIDRDTNHLGEYDVSTGTFTDRGVISGLPNVTVLAAYGLNGKLYVASNSTNKLYTVDGVGGGVSPQANEVGTITGATVQGADIVVDSTGTMFLHTNDDDTLYTVDYMNPDGNGDIATTAVGTDAGSSLTGLAVRDSGQGDLVGSSRADDAIVFLDKTNGTRTSQSDMTLGGDPYTYSNGDMATGTVVEEGCVECTTDELLAKYEFACVEEVEGDCVEYDFVFEKGLGENLVTYEAGSYESKPGEDFEPISATFGTDLCGVYAVVKAGNNLEVQELINRDGNVTVEYIEPYAISFVEFYCDEEEAEEAVEEFTSRTGCINTRDLGRGQEPFECPQDREIERGGSRDGLDRGSGRLGRGIQRDSRTEQRRRGRGSRGSRGRR